MTTATDDSARLGRLEGRLDEQSATLQELRDGQRELNTRLDAGLQGIRKEIQEIRAGQRQMFLTMLTIGGTLVVGLMAVIVALISSSGA